MNFTNEELKQLNQALSYGIANSRSEVETAEFTLLKVKMIEKTNPDTHGWVDARFGLGWKENAIKNYSVDAIAEIAMTQGRKCILLERKLKQDTE